MAERIQLRRTKGWRKPPGAVVVSRPSKWGNQHRIPPLPDYPTGGASMKRVTADRKERFQCVEMFRSDLIKGRLAFSVDDVRRELRGKALACWCPLHYHDGQRCPCHADVLLEVANG